MLFLSILLTDLPSNGTMPIILSSSFVSGSLINRDFLLLQTAQFDQNIILPSSDFTSFGFYFLYFSCTSNSKATLFYIWLQLSNN